MAMPTPTLNGATIRANLSNGANAGTWQLRFKNEVNSSAIVVKTGSYCSYEVY